MAKVAYVRVSTIEQNIDRQLDGLTFDKTFTDKASGGDTDRPALEQLIEYVRYGDHVFIHSIDRLARNLRDLQDLIEKFLEMGVSLTFKKEGLTFERDNNPFQKLQLQIIGAVAEFERSIIKERQREGIAKAKVKGVYKGGKKTINRDKIKELSDKGLNPTQIAKELSVSRMSVYRILKEVNK